MVSEVAEEEVSTDSTHRQAKDYTLEEAVEAFGLLYSDQISKYNKHRWKIETMSDYILPSEYFCKVSPSADLLEPCNDGWPG